MPPWIATLGIVAGRNSQCIDARYWPRSEILRSTCGDRTSSLSAFTLVVQTDTSFAQKTPIRVRHAVAAADGYQRAVAARADSHAGAGAFAAIRVAEDPLPACLRRVLTAVRIGGARPEMTRRRCKTAIRAVRRQAQSRDEAAARPRTVRVAPAWGRAGAFSTRGIDASTFAIHRGRAHACAHGDARVGIGASVAATDRRICLSAIEGSACHTVAGADAEHLVGKANLVDLAIGIRGTTVRF